MYEIMFHTLGLFHNVFNLLEDTSRETSFRGRKLEDKCVIGEPRHRMLLSSGNKFVKFPFMSCASFISSILKLDNLSNISGAISPCMDMSNIRPSILLLP